MPQPQFFFIYSLNSIYNNNNNNNEVFECPFSIEPKARTTNIPTKRCKVPDTQNSHAARTNVSLISLSLHLHTLHSSLAGNSGRLTWLRLQQLQEQCYPFRTVCVIFLCIQTKVWLPGLGIFHMRTDVNARNCTWLAVVCVCLCAFVCACVCMCVCVCVHACMSVRTHWSRLWKKNPLLHRGIEPASTVCQFGALPTELHLRRSKTTRFCNTRFTVMGFKINELIRSKDRNNQSVMTHTYPG